MLEHLAKKIATSDRTHFGTGVPEEVIHDAEVVLEVTFPESYRWWLVQYGAGLLRGYELQGLCPQMPSQRDAHEIIVGDIVATTLMNRTDGLPEHLLELIDYEGDEVFYLDLSQSIGGESPVVCRLPGEGGLETVASSFADFLEQEL